MVEGDTYVAVLLTREATITWMRELKYVLCINGLLWMGLAVVVMVIVVTCYSPGDGKGLI